MYDPAYKYNYGFKVIVANFNAFTETADLDQTGDESTMENNAYGEPGSSLLGRVLGKPAVTRGMQTVLLCDAHRNRPRIYCHRHKYHKPLPDKNKHL